MTHLSEKEYKRIIKKRTVEKSLDKQFGPSKEKRWPYSMKNSSSRKVCLICQDPRPLHKSMPGLYGGKCHKDYVLTKTYNDDLAKLIREKIKMGKYLAKKSR